MPLLPRFDPPANMADFQRRPILYDEWNSAVSEWFDGAIGQETAKLPGDKVQFYNPAKTDPGPVIAQAITWNAFPKELIRKYGRARALVEGDRLSPLSQYRAPWAGLATFKTTYYRPQNEYCEWHAERDPNTGKIFRVTFSSEPPEYWQALYGESVQGNDGNFNAFSGDPEFVLDLYRTLVSPEVQPEDLIAAYDVVDPAGNVMVQRGHYNLYNKWNTTHGIAHLAAPPNSLTAEIQLGADATILYQDARGRPVVEPDALVCCAAYGGPDRNSDPTIGAAVNALAALGAYVALLNPVGLYMDHIDLAGWEAPDGRNPEEFVRIVRGELGMIERLVVEVPNGVGYDVGDILIGGEEVRYGGQIAECITVKLTGIAGGIGHFGNGRSPCSSRCCMDVQAADTLNRPIPLSVPTPVGMRTVLVDEGEERAALSLLSQAPHFHRHPGKSRLP